MTLITDPARPRGRPFPKGMSGNPSGRPPGSRNRRTLQFEALIDAAGEALLTTLIERALEGDTAALRLCIKLIFPMGRPRRIEFALPALEKVGDCMQAHAMIIDATAGGQIPLDEAKVLSDLVETHRRALNRAEDDASARVM